MNAVQPLPKLVVIGYTNLDEDIFSSGQKTQKIQHLGGGGFFAAKSATSELSAEEVIFISKVGKDFDFSRLNGVNTTGVGGSSLPTSRCIQTYSQEKGEEKREIRQLAGASQRLHASALGSALPPGSRWVHIATMPPLQQRAFLQRVRKIAPRVIISLDSDSFLFQNTGNLALIKENFLQADVVFMNRSEWKIIMKSQKDFAPLLPLLVVKKDRDGAELHVKGKFLLSVSAPVVNGTNFTGAGDVFAGAYASWFVRNLPRLGAGRKLGTGPEHTFVPEPGHEVDPKFELGQVLHEQHRFALQHAVAAASRFVEVGWGR